MIDLKEIGNHKHTEQSKKDFIQLLICEGLYLTLVIFWMFLLFSSVSLTSPDNRQTNFNESSRLMDSP